MKNINLLVIFLTLFLLSSLSFSQSESAVKKTKSGVEKKISSDTKIIKAAENNINSVKTDESCETKMSDACCSTGTKEMRASISEKHGKDCDCDNCKTASADMKSLINAHGDKCDCEGCMTASVEPVKKHSNDCSCKACAEA